MATIKLEWTGQATVPKGGGIALSQRKVYGALLIAPVIKRNGVPIPPDSDGLTRYKVAHGHDGETMRAFLAMSPEAQSVVLPVAKRGRRALVGEPLAVFLSGAQKVKETPAPTAE